MGRYYTGDIEGKFWFGVQSSDDGEFFGAEEQEPNFVDYYVSDIKLVEEGLEECKKKLGENKKILDDFFDSLQNGYNDEMIITWYQDKHELTITEEYVRGILEWYARLNLGEKIYECMKEHGECYFNAEL